MVDLDRIADQLVAWESLDSWRRPEDPAALYEAPAEEAAELRRRAALLRRFDAVFGTTGPVLADPIQVEEFPTVPGCTIRGVLGRGGMGLVYRAWQEQLEREVAVKVMTGAANSSAVHSRRFVQEARLLARLRHEHIVPVYEAALHLGEPYFVMELMAGSLAGERQRFTEPRVAAGLIEQVARAVQHAHEQEILHRDLKPANILLDEQGRPRVSDFGLAKLFNSAPEPASDDSQASRDTTLEFGETGLTSTNVVLGTPPYMAPEQFENSSQVGPAADIWALGVILYELLTGQRPFAANSPVALRREILEKDPPRPRAIKAKLPRALEAIVLKCLQKSPADRYATAGALADDLARWQAGNAPAAYPDGPARSLWRLVRRHSTAAVILLLILAGVATAVASAIVSYRKAPERVRESIAQSLDAGRPAVLIGDVGVPRQPVMTLGADTTHRSTNLDRPFYVSTQGVALIELWPNPPPKYRFEVDVRHEDNPAGGTIGMFFDYRPADVTIMQPNCYVITYTDRGSNARQLKLPGGERGNRVALSFQHFETAEEGVLFDHSHLMNSHITHLPPTPTAVPSPWRHLQIDVGTQAVLIRWLPGESQPAQEVRIDESAVQRHARLLQLGVPALRGYEGRPIQRGPLGLYVSRSAASFRNAILTPLSVEP